MKYFVSLLLFLSLHICFAQDSHILRIVAYKGDVKLDGDTVNSGQLVPSTSRTIEVGKKGSYAYVLTPKGYAMKLMTGRYEVNNVEDFIYRNRYKPGSFLTGAIERPAPLPLEFVGINESEPNYLMNDSIYLKWKQKERVNKIITPPYRLSFTTLFNDTLYGTKVNDNFVKMNLRSIAKNEMAVIVGINHGDCDIQVIKFSTASDTKWILADLEKISEQPSEDLLKLIIYDCNKLNVDVMFKLFNISKTDSSSFDNDLKNYLALLKAKYEFN